MALSLTGEKNQQDRTLRQDRHNQALKTALQAMSLLAQASPDGSDHPRDPENAGITGAKVTDASSALDPNWIRSDLFDRTTFKGWLLTGRTGLDFAQDRSDHGFSLDPVHRWAEWFRLDLLADRMTVWCPWPVNAGDEIALRDAYFVRTGDNVAADRFREGLRRARSQKKLLNDADLKAIAEPHSASVLGVFTTLAPWNANALPEEQLRALLAYPPFGLPDPVAAAGILLTERTNGRIAAGRLPKLLSLPPDHPLFAYLGTLTLVWKVEVPAGDETLVSYWQRAGSPQPGQKPEYAPLAREWVKGSQS